MPRWHVPASFITALSRHTMSWRPCLGCQSDSNNPASSYKSDRVCLPWSNALIPQLSKFTWVRLECVRPDFLLCRLLYAADCRVQSWRAGHPTDIAA